MATPPPAVELAINLDNVLAQLRNWPGLAPFASWEFAHARLRGSNSPVEAQLTVLARGRLASAPPQLTFEVDLIVAIDPPTGTVANQPEMAELLRDQRTRLDTLAPKALASNEVQSWLTSATTPMARFNDLGGDDRLTFRALDGASHPLEFRAPTTP
ncbi:MAG: hypothetical protein ACI9OJ_002169 [Myxococcota bacterium]|jgi:hypothetical protein